MELCFFFFFFAPRSDGESLCIERKVMERDIELQEKEDHKGCCQRPIWCIQ